MNEKILSENADKPKLKPKFSDISKLLSSYYSTIATEPVNFGTSGHRGSSLNGSFNEKHIASISQAICEYRSKNKITGPIFLGIDTHALSKPAYQTALEVFSANSCEVIINKNEGYTPTPVISFLILEYNRLNKQRKADGVIITPSHNPPVDGGIKYNPPHGGPADVDVTNAIQERANQLLSSKNSEIKRIPYPNACKSQTIHEQNFIEPFVNSLSQVVDMDVIKDSGVKIGVDPMGGASVSFWDFIADTYNLNIEVVNHVVDPTFTFMPLDYDGKIRMDCSSSHAMANLLNIAKKFDIAWGNDPDCDRHGIVCSDELMNPNHYLSVAIWYLLQHRKKWKKNLSVGKTIVSSSMINKVVEGFGQKVFEVPVGFKWFVRGLLNGEINFGGEESAGAAFLRKDGTVWTTDKDGFSLALLAAEILAKTSKMPLEIYKDTIVSKYGKPFYRRVDSKITEDQKIKLSKINSNSIRATSLASIPIQKIETKALGNNYHIGGIKVTLTDGSWFAIRPSGTEPVMKFYIESYGGEELWKKIHDEALNMIFY